MNERRLDDLIRAAAPVSDAALDRLARTVPLDELSEEIMSTTTHPPITGDGTSDTDDRPAEPIVVRRRTSPPVHRRRGARLVALAAAAVAVLSVGVAVNLRDGSGNAWAAELVAFAERSPLLLLDDAEVTYADQYGTEGEMAFSIGGDEATLHWRDGTLADWLDDRLHGGEDLGTHGVVGGDATIIRYDDTDDYTALWTIDDRVVEFRSIAAGVGDFHALLDDLERTDVDGWLSAMPDSVIERASQAETIDEMLVGVPQPPGFDRDALAGEALVTDRYQLGARVVGAVACGWFEHWIAALEAGDSAAAAEAAAALQTSPDWPVIQEMNRSGAYGQVLDSYVTALQDGGELAPSGATVQETYRDALGC